MSPRRLQAVLVLYLRTPEQSKAFRSLRTVLNQLPDLTSRLNLLVYDNSPHATLSSSALPPWAEYVHDERNPGLASPYNRALSRAVENGSEWLLLLDQDTEVTKSYFSEFLSCEELVSEDKSIVAIVPHLLDQGKASSPLWRSGAFAKPVEKEVSGAVVGQLTAFNSGAFVRVSALEKIGGFPDCYPIESLDHVTFHLLQRNAGRIYVMRSQLDHSLSMNRPAAAMTRERYVLALRAEMRFHKEFGSWRDAYGMRLKLLRLALKQVLLWKDRKLALTTLRFAVFGT